MGPSHYQLKPGEFPAENSATYIGGELIACGTCAMCTTGRPSQCDRRPPVTGSGHDGAFARFVVTAAAGVVAVENGVSLRTAALISVAIEAAASGQLVIGGFPSHTATDAIDRIINLYPPEHRRQVQLALAENLRGVVAQVLLLKSGGGGRLAAREVLLNTPAVASVIAEGRTSQLPMAIEGGRMHGMAPLNDALVGLVQSGAVDVREAYRHAADRTGFLELLKRQGIDTSVLERLA